jgi:SAM-dependent methyltransferase
MHTTAMNNGKDFFNTYTAHLQPSTVLDIGAQDVNGSLKSVCPTHHKYIGVDFVEGKGVDVILTDPYKLPFDDNTADIIVSSSCFEHAEFFWLSYLDIMRVLKPTGVFYLSVPFNGPFHRYPVDCWRFYPDSGNALVNWGRRNGLTSNLLLESYVSTQDATAALDSRWNDFTAVILKDGNNFATYPRRITNSRTDVENVIQFGVGEFKNYQFFPEDQRARFIQPRS